MATNTVPLEQREKIVALRSHGASLQQIARRVGCSASTARLWTIARRAACGHLTQRRSGDCSDCHRAALAPLRVCPTCGGSKSVKGTVCAFCRAGVRSDGDQRRYFCRGCQRWRNQRAFSPRPFSRRPVRNLCRECESAATGRRAQRDPQKHNARGAVYRALKRGDLVRKPCEECGAEPAHAHHDDYSRPLDVRWLCPPCHTAVCPRAA